MERLVNMATGAEIRVPSGAQAELLLRSGFRQAGRMPAEANAHEPADEAAPDAGSTVSEIRAWAKARGIDLSGIKSKEKMLTAIKEA